jgi:hypothetical protein
MLTTHSVSKLAARWEQARNRLANIREKADETIGHALQAIEVSGVAFGMSYANERFGSGEVKVAGLPVDIAGGIALHGLALLGGVSSKYTDHVHNVADGLLATYAVRQGAHLGQQARTSSSTGWAPAGAFRSGYAPAGTYAGYAPAGAYRS